MCTGKWLGRAIDRQSSKLPTAKGDDQLFFKELIKVNLYFKTKFRRVNLF